MTTGSDSADSRVQRAPLRILCQHDHGSCAACVRVYHFRDRSPADEPLPSLHGHGHSVPGLEEALLGKQVGDALDVVVPPEKAYGPRNGKQQKVPRSAFSAGADLRVGMQVMSRDEQGRSFPMWIAKLQGSTVVLDANHPLAGVTLHFSVKVDGMREATEDEKKHGHAHGRDGHGHHH